MHRTEHAGAKNGGGYWGPRAIAKDKSKTKRRRNGQKIVRDEVQVSLRKDSRP